ncbi:cell filamentation protein Fic, partial [Rhizobium leguminosarum]|nr:cell filamentation protein Fic [Rhizobium leguminosarum]
FFQRSPLEAQVVLGAARDVSGILGRLLDGGHSAIAGRIAGAFRRVGRDGFADEITKTMKSAGYDVRESDPFAEQVYVPAIVAGVAPIVARLNAIWDSQRGAITEIFPKAPGLPADKGRFMKFVEDIYE